MNQAVDKYLALVTSEHGDQPNYIAALTALLQGVVDINNITAQFTTDYDLDSAVGNQIDALGQWIGLSRKVLVYTPGTFFAFDTSGVGFDQGLWHSSLDNTYTIVSLTDEIYRLMLRIKIAINYWDGSFGQAAELLDALGRAIAGNTIVDQYMLGIFPNQNDAGNTTFFDLFGNVVTVTDPTAQISNTGVAIIGYRIFLVDNFDMSITIGMAGSLPSNLIVSLLKNDALFLRPAGVKIREVMAVTVDRTPLFGFDVSNDYIGGFDVGSWGQAF